MNASTYFAFYLLARTPSLDSKQSAGHCGTLHWVLLSQWTLPPCSTEAAVIGPVCWELLTVVHWSHKQESSVMSWVEEEANASPLISLLFPQRGRAPNRPHCHGALRPLIWSSLPAPSTSLNSNVGRCHLGEQHRKERIWRTAFT